MFVNPCSYEAVTIVLRKIGVESGISQYGTGDRKWVIVVCDGVPYNLCRRVINSYTICPNCNESINGKDACLKHFTSIHGDNIEGIDFKKEFVWVLLQPGPGHIEMNMVKGFVELTWDVF